MTQPTTPIDLYFDFLCPYAWRGLELADVLRREHGLVFRLRHFSLVGGNHPDNPDRKAPTWWLSDQPEQDAGMGSLDAFLAGQAALRQDEAAAWAFTLGLFRARHAQGQALNAGTVQAVAAATLDLPTYQQDRADAAGLRAALRADLDASSRLGVFGTPTFDVGGGHVAYLRYTNLVTEPAAVLALWQRYLGVLHDDARIETIKRAK
jgi:2-hydroxychromene-2-carboxylate isomerase